MVTHNIHVINGAPEDIPLLETDLLIVGAGPAGASLACFLASYGLKGIMIGAASGTAETPRAHITNMAALECLRDIGLEEACLKVAHSGKNMLHTRWCYTLCGEEFARTYSWGNDPKRKGDYDSASPCEPVDLPQTELEPILVRYATHNGFKCRLDTNWVTHKVEDSGSILSTVKDMMTGHHYFIRSKYLFGCDGARSPILKELQIPLIQKPGQGLAINVLVEADLSHVVESRMGNLHWVLQPDVKKSDYGWAGLVRMVQPWHRWMFIMIPKPGTGVTFTTSREEYMHRVKEMIGDDSVKVEIVDVSKWYINETVASEYSKGNVFCLGDAVHRHPPFNGLGSNTCVQDAYNLAWKIAYVMAGKAHPSLLKTYSPERQPVGESVITRANQGLRDHGSIYQALGMMAETLDERKAELAELAEANPAGRARREKLRKGVEHSAHEFHGLGVEMNQRYDGAGIYLEDEGPRPPIPEDPVLYHQITTYPGSRLPHAWLNTTSPGKQFSTQDLAGHRAFCLLTGIGGEKWKKAAVEVGAKLGITINAYSIGWKQDYEDVYGDWAKKSEVDEDGCVLARPDRFVAWRAKNMIDGCEEKLLRVLKSVLGLE